MPRKNKNRTSSYAANKKFPLPIYKKEDDIYNRLEKLSLEETEPENPVPFDKKIGDDLDIPGSELDNDNENIGEEDEENNYYSLGGDNHEDLEEDKA